MKRWVLIGAALLAVMVSGFLVYYALDDESQPTPAEYELDRYEEMVRQEPDNLTLRIGLANLYLQNDRYQEATGQYQQILLLEEDHLGALIGLGLAYMQQGDNGEARAHFNRVVELTAGAEFAALDRRLEMVHFFLGSMYLEEGQTASAIDEFRQALAINEGNADTFHRLATALHDQGELTEAIEAYSRAVSLAPDFIEAYQGLAEAYEEEGRQGERLYAVGMVALFQDDLNEAIQQLTEATEMMPDLANAWWGLGYAWERKGAIDQALSGYVQTLELDPGHILANQGLNRLRDTRQ